MFTYIVATLDKFVRLPDYIALRNPLLNCMLGHKTIVDLLLADKAIYSTVAGSRAGIATHLEQQQQERSGRLSQMGLSQNQGTIHIGTPKRKTAST